ncbi:hypothetical protein F2Q65_00980 [Thiohalocapsa marina]|uniref:Transposase n=1 Tax=Thiohalocapsa marina TaxID=424902 RepID=A0A5M8FVP0_9GAMM|nr:hypothetical protein [Thiohalocapsa marina]KAA6187845.1 hypothetical protein F2Q65_00980 [Thiohalocapsa marina]
MRTPSGRKALSAERLLRTARGVFATLPDAPGHDIALVDHLISALALFGLKYPSLLQFDHDCRQETTTRANLKSLYWVARAPSDSRFREQLRQKLRSRFDLCLIPDWETLYRSIITRLSSRSSTTPRRAAP